MQLCYTHYVLTWMHSAWCNDCIRRSLPPSLPLSLSNSLLPPSLPPSLPPRRRLCVNECLTEYEDLPDPPPEGKPGARSLSPTHRKCPTLTLLPDTCRWKRTYLKAKQLCFNWQWGVYQVLPLMRGHRKPVISIACDGGQGVAIGLCDFCFYITCAGCGLGL